MNLKKYFEFVCSFYRKNKIKLWWKFVFENFFSNTKLLHTYYLDILYNSYSVYLNDSQILNNKLFQKWFIMINLYIYLNNDKTEYKCNLNNYDFLKYLFKNDNITKSIKYINNEEQIKYAITEIFKNFSEEYILTNLNFIFKEDYGINKYFYLIWNKIQNNYFEKLYNIIQDDHVKCKILFISIMYYLKNENYTINFDIPKFFYKKGLIYFDKFTTKHKNNEKVKFTKTIQNINEEISSNNNINSQEINNNINEEISSDNNINDEMRGNNINSQEINNNINDEIRGNNINSQEINDEIDSDSDSYFVYDKNTDYNIVLI